MGGRARGRCRGGDVGLVVGSAFFFSCLGWSGVGYGVKIPRGGRCTKRDMMAAHILVLLYGMVDVKKGRRGRTTWEGKGALFRIFVSVIGTMMNPICLMPSCGRRRDDLDLRDRRNGILQYISQPSLPAPSSSLTVILNAKRDRIMSGVPLSLPPSTSSGSRSQRQSTQDRLPYATNAYSSTFTPHHASLWSPASSASS